LNIGLLLFGPALRVNRSGQRRGPVLVADSGEYRPASGCSQPIEHRGQRRLHDHAILEGGRDTLQLGHDRPDAALQEDRFDVQRLRADRHKQRLATQDKSATALPVEELRGNIRFLLDAAGGLQRPGDRRRGRVALEDEASRRVALRGQDGDEVRPIAGRVERAERLYQYQA
jgi:hypothetical protein